MTYKRLDDSTCKINLYGYPVYPKFQIGEEEEKDLGETSDLIKNITKNNTELILVQIDPMTYLGHSRNFALKYLPSFKE